MAKSLTAHKAALMLYDGTANGQAITDKQRRYFGAIAGGAKSKIDGNRKARLKGMLSKRGA